MILTAFSGVYFFFTDRNNLQLDRELKIFIRSFLAYFILAFASFIIPLLITGKYSVDAMGDVDRAFRFALPLFLIYAFTRVSNLREILLISILAGAISLGIFAVYRLLSDSYWYGMRLESNYQAYLFGVIASWFFVALLALQGEYVNFVKRYMFSLYIIALFGAFLAMFLSGTRMAWLISFLGVFVYIFTILKNKGRRKIIFGAIFLVLAVLISSSFFETRFNTTINEYEKITKGVHGTSIGIRYEMWSMSMDMVKDSLLLGHGAGGYQQEKKNYVKPYSQKKWILTNAFPHNGYIYELVNRGIIGLLVLLLIFIYPFSLYRKFYNKNKHGPDANYALFGMVHIGVFMIASGLGTMFARSNIASFYVIITVLILYVLYAEKNQAEK